MDDAADPGSSSATHKTLSTSTAAAALARARAPMTAVAPYPPRSRHRCPSPLAVFLVVVLTTMAAGAALTRRRVGPPPQQRIPQSVGFVVPPVSAAAAAARPAACPKGVNFYSGSTRGGRGGAVLLYARKKEPSGGLPPEGADSEEDEELLTTIGGHKGKGKKGQRNKAKTTKKTNKPRPPVFTARIVLLGAPSPEWAAGVRDRLLEEGWMPDRVQALPLPDPREYSEAKWIAYMREGIKLRNATFVIAGGPLPNNSDDAAAPVPAVSTAAAQVLRFLEKHPLRGAILIAPPAQYALTGATEPSRAWEYNAVRKHCPFVGLVYPRPLRPTGKENDEEDGGWNPPPEAEAVREGLGLAPYPFGIRGPESGQEHKAIEALIRDWQFLESLGMGPIQLVGEDEEEEQEAALAKARLDKEGGGGAQEEG